MRGDNVKKILGAVAFLAVLALGTAQQQGQQQTPGQPGQQPLEQWNQPNDTQPSQAAVRFAHLVVQGEEYDVLINGQPLMEGVSAGRISDYLLLPEGSYTFELVPAGGGQQETEPQEQPEEAEDQAQPETDTGTAQPLATFEGQLEPGSYYTLIATQASSQAGQEDMPAGQEAPGQQAQQDRPQQDQDEPQQPGQDQAEEAQEGEQQELSSELQGALEDAREAVEEESEDARETVSQAIELVGQELEEVEDPQGQQASLLRSTLDSLEEAEEALADDDYEAAGEALAQAGQASPEQDPDGQPDGQAADEEPAAQDAEQEEGQPEGQDTGEQQPQVELQIIEDQVQVAPAGLAFVRFVHAATDLDSVNFVMAAQQENQEPGQQQEQQQDAQQQPEEEQQEQDAQQQEGQEAQQEAEQDAQQESAGDAQAAQQGEQQPAQDVAAGTILLTIEPRHAADASVRITGPDGFNQEQDGEGEVSGLEAGTYVVTATKQSYEPATTTVNVSEDAGAHAQLNLERLPDAGPPPLENARVISSEVSYAEGGEYQPLEPTTYSAQVQADQGDQVSLELHGITLRPGVTYTIFAFGSQETEDGLQALVRVDAIAVQQQAPEETLQQVSGGAAAAAGEQESDATTAPDSETGPADPFGDEEPDPAQVVGDDEEQEATEAEQDEPDTEPQDEQEEEDGPELNGDGEAGPPGEETL